MTMHACKSHVNRLTAVERALRLRARGRLLGRTRGCIYHMRAPPMQGLQRWPHSPGRGELVGQLQGPGCWCWRVCLVQHAIHVEGDAPCMQGCSRIADQLWGWVGAVHRRHMFSLRPAGSAHAPLQHDEHEAALR